jgi:hypothetical protein
MGHRILWRSLSVVAIVIAAAPGFAARGTALASATICPGVAVSRVSNLDFGAIPSGAVGTVVVTTAGSRTASGGIALEGLGAPPSAAEFAVSGREGMSYAITLPERVAVSDGRHSLTVEQFTASREATDLPGSGSEVLKIGATLRVEADQGPGQYRGSFEVTVSYN